MGSTENTPKVWLITGASQGLGLSLTLAALRSGHKVIATARQLEKARSQHPEVENEGGIWIELDVTHPDVQFQVDAAIREYGGGRIDVVVNNAGYTFVAPMEDMLDEEMLLSLQTHVMGPFRIIKAALPYMRAQNSGTLVLNGSCLGMRPFPGGSAYSTAKAAGDMLYETLRLELRTFNIRTLILNSGLIQTGVLANAPQPKQGVSEHYANEGTALNACMPYIVQVLSDPAAMRGDPLKWSNRVVELVDRSGTYGSALSGATRVLLGPDSVSLADQQVERLQREIDQSRGIAASTDKEGISGVGMEFLAEISP